jgi:hypothetical protein
MNISNAVYIDRINILKSTINNIVDKDLLCIPNFIIAAPAKTASTWLAKILDSNRDVSIPSVKEVKFFCTYYRWYGINWYSKYFSDFTTLWKGDSSGTYFILPVETIKLLKDLNCDCKIIITLRNPVNRLWSHLKHDFKYKTSTLREHKKSLKDIDLPQLIQYVIDAWQLAWCDYEGALRRWSSVFDKEKIVIGFYEEIESNPMIFLEKIHSFFGLSKDYSDNDAHEIIFRGIEYSMPEDFRDFLYSFFYNDTVRLNKYLYDEFNVSVPESWSYKSTIKSIGPICINNNINEHVIELVNDKFIVSKLPDIDSKISSEVFDTYKEALYYANDNKMSSGDILISALNYKQIWQEVRFLEIYHNYSILHYGTAFYAVYKAFVDIGSSEDKTIEHYMTRGLIHVADTPVELKLNIDNYLFGNEIQPLSAACHQMNSEKSISSAVSLRYTQIMNQLETEANYELPPKLIFEYRGFNIVRYRNSLLAFAQSIGHVDVTTVTPQIWEYFMSNKLVCSSKTEDGIKAEVDKLV